MTMRSLNVVAAAVAVLAAGQAALAGPIFWTPSSGSNAQITYSDGQSDNGLYGNPTVVGDLFQFLTPHDFIANASSNNANTTTDRLSFQVSGSTGDLSKVLITEFGDWSVFGGTGAIKDTGALFVTDLTPAHFGTVYSLTPTVSYLNTDTNTTVTTPGFPSAAGEGTWQATYTLTLPAGVKSAQVVLNNVLQAIAGAGATSFIEKKGISITTVDPIPEPASLALVVLGGTAMIRRRRSA